MAIDCLPLGTRKAMLEGVDENRIIVGAYVDREGGICPMLAAHRHGGRTSLASFARAWDRYTKAKAPRPASDREVRTLRTMLEASIALDEFGWREELSKVIAEHQALKSGRPEPPGPKRGAERRGAVGAERPGERDRTGEVQGHHGWAWLRPFRRLDAYEEALRQIEEVERGRRETLESERDDSSPFAAV